MVAEARNLYTSSGAGLQHRGARLYLNRLSVDKDLKKVAGGWCTCGQLSDRWERCLSGGGGGEKAMANSLDDVALLLLS